MADGDDRGNVLRRILEDLRDLVDLLVKLVSDEELSQAAFGFSVDVGLVSELTVLVDELDAAADGPVDLAAFSAGAARLAELTEAVELLVEAAEADLPPGVAAQEAIGVVLDTVGLTYVAGRWPVLLYLARLLGLLTENLPQEATGEAIEATGAAFWRIVTWDRVGELLSDAWDSLTGPLETDADARRLSAYLAAIGMTVAFTPLLVDKLFHRHIDPRSFEVLHGWEADPESTTPVADRISQRFVTLLARLSGETTAEDGTVVENELELTLTLAFVPREHGGPGLWLSLGVGAGRDVHLGDGWHFVAEGELGDGLDAFVPGSTAPDGAGFVRLGADIGGAAEIRIERRDEAAEEGGPAQPWRIGEVLEVKAAELGVRIGDHEPMLEAVLRLRDAALVVSRPAKGFFRHLVPEGGVRVDFDLGLVADSTPRFHVEGGTGLEVTIPVHTSTPKLQGLHAFLALRPRPEGQEEGPALTFEASAGFGTRLGSFSAAVDRFGVILPEAPHGLPGAPWVKLPNAIGIGLDGELVKGGGFILFDPERGRYAGALALTMGRWSLTAFGLLTDLEEGYSLLVVVAMRFQPPFKGPAARRRAGDAAPARGGRCGGSRALTSVRSGGSRAGAAPRRGRWPRRSLHRDGPGRAPRGLEAGRLRADSARRAPRARPELGAREGPAGGARGSL